MLHPENNLETVIVKQQELEWAVEVPVVAAIDLMDIIAARSGNTVELSDAGGNVVNVLEHSIGYYEIKAIVRQRHSFERGVDAADDAIGIALRFEDGCQGHRSEAGSLCASSWRSKA
jgi:hypothetical protein